MFVINQYRFQRWGRYFFWGRMCRKIASGADWSAGLYSLLSMLYKVFAMAVLMDGNGNGKLEGIAALRGFAALYVFLYHLTLIPQPQLMPPLGLQTFILNGGSGVSLFFLISAYTLALSVHRKGAEPMAVCGFYLRRFFRIAPLFWCVLFFSLLYQFSHGVWVNPREVMANFLFLFNVTPGWEQGLVDASWTIGVEMLFYLFFPFLFRFANSLSRAASLLLLALFLSVVFHSLNDFTALFGVDAQRFMQMSLINQLPLFMMGLVCFRLIGAVRNLASMTKGVGVLFFSVFLWGSVSVWTGRMNFAIDPMYWVGVFYGFLLLACLVSPSRLFVNGVAIFYGEISFSLYLLHPIVIHYVSPLYSFIRRMGVSTGLEWLLCVAVTLPFLTFFAWLSFKFIESSGIAFGNSIIRRYLNDRRIPKVAH